MTDDRLTLRGRLRIARKEWEKRNPDINQTEIGRRVGVVLGRRVSQEKVSRWFRGQQPRLVELLALAEVFGVDPCELAFGEISGAGTGARTLPRRGPTPDSDEEERRA